jgi:hypothetical protein
VLQPLCFEHPRVHVVLEVTVVDRETDAVESERGEESGVGVGEEVFEKLGVGVGSARAQWRTARVG